jgi:hypothetical protein
MGFNRLHHKHLLASQQLQETAPPSNLGTTSRRERERTTKEKTGGPDAKRELEVIIPSEHGITAEQRWRQDATMCPVNWPTDYSLLRAWHFMSQPVQEEWVPAHV